MTHVAIQGDVTAVFAAISSLGSRPMIIVWYVTCETFLGPLGVVERPYRHDKREAGNTTPNRAAGTSRSNW